MKILMLSWEYPPRIVGGISRVVCDLATHIGKKNHQVHVVTCMEGDAKEFEQNNNVFVHRVHAYHDITAYDFINWILHLNFALIEECNKIIKESGTFDIIHAHDWMVAFAARVLKHSYSIPLVCTIHATEHGRNHGTHNEVQRYISNVEWWLTYESWKVIVNSNFMKQEVMNIFQLPEDKIEIIHNGVDIDKFEGYSNDINFRRMFAADDEKIIFFVGRLVEEKGVNVLIDAMPKILHYYNKVKFVIVGKGPQLDHLKWRINDMNISHKVYFTGYIDDENLLKLYKCVDVAVFPSLYEPFGIVALEGMVAKAPVVVSDTGGLGSIVEHGINGMKAYTGNANSLADNILEILHNPEQAEIIKQNAYKKVLDVYNWNTISDYVIEIYNKIIN